jgi:hypothetical protein
MSYWGMVKFTLCNCAVRNPIWLPRPYMGCLASPTTRHMDMSSPNAPDAIPEDTIANASSPQIVKHSEYYFDDIIFLVSTYHKRWWQSRSLTSSARWRTSCSKSLAAALRPNRKSSPICFDFQRPLQRMAVRFRWTDRAMTSLCV